MARRDAGLPVDGRTWSVGRFTQTHIASGGSIRGSSHGARSHGRAVSTASAVLSSRFLYGLDPPAADIDVVELTPRAAAETGTMMKFGVRDGRLHQKCRICLDHLAVAAIPESCEARFVGMFPAADRNLLSEPSSDGPRSLRSGPSKLERNSQKECDDVRFLARSVTFDLDGCAGAIRDETALGRSESPNGRT
jgi:hypothetical protein